MLPFAAGCPGVACDKELSGFSALKKSRVRPVSGVQCPVVVSKKENLSQIAKMNL